MKKYKKIVVKDLGSFCTARPQKFSDEKEFLILNRSKSSETHSNSLKLCQI